MCYENQTRTNAFWSQKESEKLVSKSAVAAEVKTTASPLRAKLSNGLQVVLQDNGGAVSQLVSLSSRENPSAASGGQMNSFNAEYALSILGQVASCPAFKPWEIEDVLPTIRADLTRKTPHGIVFEDIYRAAFRSDSLGHSLYAQKNEIGGFGSEEMKEFAKKHFVNGRPKISFLEEF
uniref:SWIB domain-containing protein n=1 Tax=Caenorhabditis tropicalis TaxID=1561998 RepID=A0A1I7UYZ9_9PELO